MRVTPPIDAGLLWRNEKRGENLGTSILISAWLKYMLLCDQCYHRNGPPNKHYKREGHDDVFYENLTYLMTGCAAIETVNGEMPGQNKIFLDDVKTVVVNLVMQINASFSLTASHSGSDGKVFSGWR
jgi:hypothetical protein